MSSEFVNDCCKILTERKLTIAFAESCTAGKLAYEFSLTENSGQVLKGGIVCYDAQVKEELLKIPKELIECYTPESAEVTEQLAVRLKDLISSDIQVAVTGLTSVGGSETIQKPVGSIFIHIVLPGHSQSLYKHFSGTPEVVVTKAVEQVAKSLTSILTDEHVR